MRSGPRSACARGATPSSSGRDRRSPLSDDDRRTETELRERIRQLQRAIVDEDDAGAVREPATGLSPGSRANSLVAEQEYQAFLDDRAGAQLGAAATAAIPSARRRSRPDSQRTKRCSSTWSDASSLMVFVLTARGVIGKDERRCVART